MSTAETSGPALPPEDHHTPIDEQQHPGPDGERLLSGTSDLLEGHRVLTQRIIDHGEDVVRADLATTAADQKIMRRFHREHLADLEDRATHDGLTGLYNGHTFRSLLAKATRGEEKTALLSIDLDGFKKVNDTLGHLVGDRVLQAAARGIRGAVRKGDAAGRLGGDEFAVLLEEFDVADPKRAQKLIDETARKISSGAQAEMIAVLREELGLAEDQAVPIDVGASVGYAIRRHNESADDLLRHADAHLYVKKRGQRQPTDNQQGFIPMIIMMILMILVVIGFAAWRVASS